MEGEVVWLRKIEAIRVDQATAKRWTHDAATEDEPMFHPSLIRVASRARAALGVGFRAVACFVSPRRPCQQARRKASKDTHPSIT